MSINILPVEIKCVVFLKDKKSINISTQNMDFDLVLTKLTRLLETESEATLITLDTLKIDTAAVRSSLYITHLGALVNFLTNMQEYQQSQSDRPVLQSVSEYIATYDHLYHEIHPTDVVKHIQDSVIVSYYRANKPKLDRGLPHPVEVAINWLVILKRV